MISSCINQASHNSNVSNGHCGQNTGMWSRTISHMLHWPKIKAKCDQTCDLRLRYKSAITYVTLSAKTHIVRTIPIFFPKHYLQCLRSEYSKFQLNQASNFEVIALDSRASKKIDLYSNHTENKLQALTFAAITSSLHLSTALEFSLKCSPVIGQTSKL